MYTHCTSLAINLVLRVPMGRRRRIRPGGAWRHRSSQGGEPSPRRIRPEGYTP